MMGGGGGESLFVAIPLLMLLLAVLWLPLWIASCIYWCVRHQKGHSANVWLKTAVFWPVVPVLLSAVGGSLSVVYGNGPSRVAPQIAEELWDVETSSLVEDRETTSNRRSGCGTATLGNLDLSSQTDLQPRDKEQFTQLLRERAKAARSDGWTHVAVKRLRDNGGTVVSGERDDNTRFSYRFTEFGSDQLRVEVCRSDDWKIGFDLLLFGAAVGWAAAFCGGVWLWRTRGPIRDVALALVIAAIPMIGVVAASRWIG